MEDSHLPVKKNITLKNLQVNLEHALKGYLYCQMITSIKCAVPLFKKTFDIF